MLTICPILKINIYCVRTWVNLGEAARVVQQKKPLPPCEAEVQTGLEEEQLT